MKHTEDGNRRACTRLKQLLQLNGSDASSAGLSDELNIPVGSRDDTKFFTYVVSLNTRQTRTLNRKLQEQIEDLECQPA